MFQICGLFILVLVSLTFPGLFLFTIPLAIIWADSMHRKVVRLRACRDLFIEHEKEQERLKVLRSL